MSPSTPQPVFTYREPLFRFSLAGRFLARSISGLGWIAVALIALIFLASGSTRFVFGGLLLALIVISRLVSLGKSERKIDRRNISTTGALELSRFVAPSTRRILLSSLDRATLAGRKDLFIHAVLSSLLSVRSVRHMLERAEYRPSREAPAIPSAQARRETAEPISSARELISLAFLEAVNLGQASIWPQHLLIALAAFPDPAISRFFETHNLSGSELRAALLLSMLSSRVYLRPRSIRRFLPPERRLPHHVMNRAWTARPTPFLDQFSQDLTDRARAGDVGFLVGREEEFESLVNILSRSERANALLVGEEGVGRETLVQHLAWRVTRDEVPPELFDRRVIKLDFASLSAGARTPGELQERVRRAIQEIVTAGNVILFIPDVHNLVEGVEGVSAAEILKPILTSAVLPLVASTTPENYAGLIEKRSDFGASFEVIRVHELSQDEATRYLAFASSILETKGKVRVSAPAIVRAVELAGQLLRDKPLPISAQDLLSEALEAKRRERARWVLAKDIEALVTKRTGVPSAAARPEEAMRLLNLEVELHKRVVNQEEGVRVVAQALREYRAGITTATRPIANFLFVGPTGVGKTETAKALAQIYFGGEKAMIRLDMSEYQTQESIARFLGSRETGIKGTLTEAVKRQPYALLLLDEFEKAHPDLLNVFLQVFDDGRLTDVFGTTVDFTHTIIIATSNAHSTFVKSEIEKGRAVAEIEEELKKKLVDYFKPELLNRFDRIVMFKPLTLENLEKIVEIQLSQLATILAQRHGIEVSFASEAKEELVRLGYSPVYGARPLRSVIREKIRAPLAEAILRGELPRGAMAQVAMEAGQFQIRAS